MQLCVLPRAAEARLGRGTEPRAHLQARMVAAARSEDKATDHTVKVLGHCIYVHVCSFFIFMYSL